MRLDSDQRLQCVLELSGNCYWEQDEQQRFTLLGGSTCRIAPANQLAGAAPWSPWGNPVHGTCEEHQALWQAKLPFADLLVVCRESGRRERYFNVSGQPFFDAEGLFKGYRGIAAEVTEEKRIERLLRLEHEVSRLLEAEDEHAALTGALRAVCESEGWIAARFCRVDDDGGVIAIHEAGHTSPERLEEGVREARAVGSGPGAARTAAASATAEPMSSADRTFLCPVLSRDRTIGVLEFTLGQAPEPDERVSSVIRSLANRIGGLCARATTLDRLRESEEHYSSTIELAAIGISHVSLDGRFIHVNRRLCEMLGYSKEELLQLTVWQVSHPEDVSATDREARRLRAREVDSFKIEKRYVRKNGAPIWVRITATSKWSPQGQALYDISVVEDISDRREAEERVKYLATHDEMTDLPNRTMFGQLLTLAIERGRRYHRRVALLFIDLDRFKIINDCLGHEAGDELLKAMATRLRENMRASDVLARLGGDEFVLLAEELAERDTAAIVARNLLSTVMKPVKILGHECRVTASVGISVFPDDAHDAKTLMKNADMAMYRAKEDGKNNYQFYSPQISALSVERLVIENHLRQALDRGELSLHYQAKVDFKTGDISGVEALLRWWNPELGSVPPARFIPIAEDCGLIIQIGRWAMRAACAQSAAWLRDGLPQVCMAINLSPRQFQDSNLITDIADMLRETALPPQLLEFEITESMIVHDMDQALAKLGAMKAMGVRVAIDDFGTGYSSLAQLKRFPIDTLKVDRSFIRDIPGNKEDRAITEAIISMGRSLGVVVVAEGVETAEQQTFLKRLACDEMQGFYFSSPTEPDTFAELLRKHVPAPLD